MRHLILAITLPAIVLSSLSAQTINHWRGPARDGIYPEVGLQKVWPEDGPHIAWVYDGINAGYSSPSIANNRIYITGTVEDNGYIYVLNLDGELLQTFPYGPEKPDEFYGSRVSPTVADDLLYIVTSTGRLVCMSSYTGDIVWTKEYLTDFDGKNIDWGFTENLIVDGDTLFATPGGQQYNMVALNRHTGEVIWANGGMGDQSAYNSPLLFTHNGRKILASQMAEHIVGFDARTGELLWSHKFGNYIVHPNTPIYSNGQLLFYSGYTTGAVKFTLSDDGSAVTKNWDNPTFDVQMGGAVLHNGYVYGAGHNNRFWFCVDWETGENVWQSRLFAHGPVIMADGMLYIYSERGELALIEPSPDELKVKGKGKVTHGTAQHWAYPVIHNGILYVRHGNALVAYNVKL